MPHITLETLGRGITASPTPTDATIVVQAWDAHGPMVQLAGPRVVSSPRNVPTPFSLTFQTADAWPSSLPGAGLGVIPVN